MRFDGEALIPAPPEMVWEGLNDPNTLCRAIPGCEAMEQTGAREFTARVVMRVGPVAATFRGKVELDDLDPPHGYTLRGQGQGGAAGFAKGEARITLVPEGGGTRLRYQAEADVGGKLASVGSRLIQGVARKTADDFFNAFGRALGGEDAPEADEEVKRTPADLRKPEAAGHIPLIDRVAWLLVGIALGVGLTVWIG
ncbi:SRPBCC family protein [Maritimibacter fusiformis]|uniref:Carbon monoxide dehydrogenase subunit G n=1 Tax=Maritimibacter fusiformis TaxID=2603819 RepID=A0A5D0RJV3_9RHOB|nr:carbon monoxide dehydrogenase subunit G [Maritimibacter fusiformis]TYB81196.1 carbon monoxide dehydrogenase subunit G [Maritimibacter fusiformis]